VPTNKIALLDGGQNGTLLALCPVPQLFAVEGAFLFDRRWWAFKGNWGLLVNGRGTLKTNADQSFQTKTNK
jgi:hypothetical protein